MNKSNSYSQLFLYGSVGVAESLPIASNSVDLLTSCTSFHYFDPKRFFKEAHRVLKPHGCLCISGYGSVAVFHEDSAISDAINAAEGDMVRVVKVMVELMPEPNQCPNRYSCMPVSPENLVQSSLISSRKSHFQLEYNKTKEIVKTNLSNLIMVLVSFDEMTLYVSDTDKRCEGVLAAGETPCGHLQKSDAAIFGYETVRMSFGAWFATEEWGGGGGGGGAQGPTSTPGPKGLQKCIVHHKN